jgi:4-hydroxy-tetrahydrodipicolinate synthase
MESLRNTLIPAVPVPFDRGGRIDRDAQLRYAKALAREPIGGVAVWAHTGRGLHLDANERAAVLTDWKAALGGRLPVVAAAGAPPALAEPAEAFASARAMADHAAALGADALLVHPPRFALGRADRDRLIVDYHSELARAGLPLILFYLYEEAGGIPYLPDELCELLALPEVIGIKIATLDSVVTFQDLARLLLERFPDVLLITGEDRFLSYSLMCGARSALIGMGAARTALQAGLLAAYFQGDGARFLRQAAAVDRLAQETFVAPMEGYIQRMLWCLVHDGLLPRDSACDPWGPPLAEHEFHQLGEFLRGLPEG